MKRKNFRSLFALLALTTASSAAAQPGIEELQQVSGTVGHWYFNLSDLALVLGAVSGLLGGLRVYVAWQSGRHHIDAQIIGWFFACIFLSLAGGALKLLFGI